jgi:surface polysaccharide O-acyltransferase-like enzyme
LDIVKKSRSAAPDIVKLIACIGVIVIHVSGQGVVDYTLGSAGWFSCVLWDSLVRFAVPVFFMCTGSLMLDPARSLPIRRIYKQYFLRVLWILLFWAWAYYIFTVVGQFLTTGWYEPHGFLNSIIQTLRFNHHLHLYYLQMLLLVYVCLPVLRVFVRAADEKEQNYAVLVWLLLGIALPLLRKYYPFSWFGGMVGFYEINMAYSALGYTLLGWVMASRMVNRAYLNRYMLMFAAGAIVTFGGTVAASLLTGTVNTDFMEGMSPGPALMAAGLFGAVRILAEGKASSARLAVLTKASFCVYLIHHFFVMIFRYVGIDVFCFAPAAEIPLETAAVFGLSLAGWWVLSKIPFVKDHLI